MNLRLYIRNTLNEAMLTPHFKERVYDRLNSELTSFKNEKQEVKDKVKSLIEFVSKVNFPGQDNIGILLLKGPSKYVYHQEIQGKTEHSEGNYVWIVVRANDLETIVFGDSAYRPKNTQIHLTIDRLMDYISTNKGGDFNLTEKDLKKLSAPPVQQVVNPSKEVLSTINVNGVQWVIDSKSEKAYKKNNSSVEMDMYAFIDGLDAPTQEKALSLI